MANNRPLTAIRPDGEVVRLDPETHPMDVSKLGLEDSPIVRLQDGRVGTKEELGIIVPRRPDQVDSEPARDIPQPPPNRASRLAEIEKKYQAVVARTPVHAKNEAGVESPMPTGVKLELKIQDGALKGTVIAVEGKDMDDSTNKLEAKMNALGEALLS